jgi:hypothetical protein
MQARDLESPALPTAPADEGTAPAPLRATIASLTETLDRARETARGMLEAEEALDLVRQSFERTEDPEIRGELAAEALMHVERQLQLTRERRRRLDSTEAKLWARQNRLEGFLIQTRGGAWWRERRNGANRNGRKSNERRPEDGHGRDD